MTFTEHLMNEKLDLQNATISLMATLKVVMKNNDLDDWAREALTEAMEKADDAMGFRPHAG